MLCKYLGLILSPYRDFNLARQGLKKIALIALYKQRKEMGDHFRENINSNNNALICPILLYGSEIWGIDSNGKIEKGSGRISAEKILKMATRYKYILY